jgi:hypothetical protein
MNVRKADEFIADVERQFRWYLANAGGEVADRYLDAVVSRRSQTVDLPIH